MLRDTAALAPGPLRISASGIVKAFGGVRALDLVDFEARAGEVHAILGQNGAGKSTLMGILAGGLQPDAGTIALDGVPIRLDSPFQALELGVAIVHQQTRLIPELSVAENILLRRLPRNRFQCVDWKRLFADARALVERLGFDLDVRKRVSGLPAAARQMTEIARALSVSAKVLILDEPSAMLSSQELDNLFRIVRQLKASGTTILYVSHRLAEIFAIADRATVLKDGKVRGTHTLDASVSPRFLIGKMVGKEWTESASVASQPEGSELLRVENLTRAGAFEDVSFTLRTGEILGLAGMVGSGRTELCRAIFGANPPDSGRLFVQGREVHIAEPRDAMAQGIAYLSEDRVGESIVSTLPVAANVTLAGLRRFTRFGKLELKNESAWAGSMIRKLGVSCRGPRQPVTQLSGGNQQKTALAKWLSTDARIFLLDEPTAGIDVAAKREIHAILQIMLSSGAAIVIVSSEIPELLTVCHRLLVMNRGRVVRELLARESSEDDVLYYASTSTEETGRRALRD